MIKNMMETLHSINLKFEGLFRGITDTMSFVLLFLGMILLAVLNDPMYAQEAEDEIITLQQIIMYEEGYSEIPYLDTEGYVTIGIGHKLFNVKGINPKSVNLTMSKEEAMYRSEKETDEVRTKLESGKYQEVFNDLDSVRQSILISMSYQLGVNGLYKFKKMWGMLYLRCYENASIEMLNSKWAKQTPERAKRHAEVIRTGSLIMYGMEISK